MISGGGKISKWLTFLNSLRSRDWMWSTTKQAQDSVRKIVHHSFKSNTGPTPYFFFLENIGQDQLVQARPFGDPPSSFYILPASIPQVCRSCWHSGRPADNVMCWFECKNNTSPPAWDRHLSPCWRRGTCQKDTRSAERAVFPQSHLISIPNNLQGVLPPSLSFLQWNFQSRQTTGWRWRGREMEAMRVFRLLYNPRKCQNPAGSSFIQRSLQRYLKELSDRRARSEAATRILMEV